ncbi:MAG: exodeoxyribonuclease VII small subunit [Spirochaetota bacterium]
MAEKRIKFEEAFKELEGIVAKLENEEPDLDKSFTLFEKGTKLAKVCSEQLAGYERQVKMLKSGKGGEKAMRLELFEQANDGE